MGARIPEWSTFSVYWIVMLAKCFPKGLFPTTRARTMKGHRLMCDYFHKQTVRDQKWLYNPHSRELDIDLKGKRGIAWTFSK